MKDTYRHRGLRKRLIDTLYQKGIRDERILNAFNSVPRHLFLDKAFEEWAYTDKAFPIGNKQTISQPFTVAYQTDLLEIKRRDKILEIGTGSGFQAAILDQLGATVLTVERQELLYKKTSELLIKLGFSNIRTFLKDGMSGLPEYAPFDKIIVTAAASEIPTALLSQLKIGGILIIPIGKERQQMCKIIKESAKQYKRIYLDYFKFVPLLKGLNKD
ncbi:MAG: protein-L-isoaspartate(D-aspartate) O-methyltransferase [Saprospiraceae bacterium]